MRFRTQIPHSADFSQHSGRQCAKRASAKLLPQTVFNFSAEASDCRMAVRQHLYLLLLLLNLSWAQEHRCQQSQFSCDQCIETGPECVWCGSPNAEVRCHTLEELQKAGCAEMYNPQPSVEILKDEPRTTQKKTGFMQPQELSIHLRPGRNQTIQLNVSLPEGQRKTYVTLEAYDIPAGLNFKLDRNIIENSGLIEVYVDAAQCPSRNQNMTGPWFVYVVSRGILQRVKLQIHLDCHCSCSSNREEKSAACSGRGARVCGRCECDQHHTGQNCQMEEDPLSVRGDDLCRLSANAPLCSGRGTCVRGSCACDKLIHPHHRYSGQYCECNNFLCPYSNNKICGGNGRCECGKCVCEAGWSGEDCLCTTNTTSCVARNGHECNSRGTCLCGVCQCTSQHMGPTCEICPTCPGICSEYGSCVECRAYGTGGKASRCDQECNYFSMKIVNSRNDLPPYAEGMKFCKLRNLDDCHFYFSILETRSENTITAVRAQECPL